MIHAVAGRLPTLLLAAALLARPVAAADTAVDAPPPPRVVATIQPIHSLVAAVMEGVGEPPTLLVRPGASPHAYQSRPSEAAALRGADLVVWVGGGLETFLAKAVGDLDGRTKVLELMAAPGVDLLPSREGGTWDDDHGGAHPDGEAAAHGPAEHGGDGARDAHLWLSPANARAIVRAVAVSLAGIDPARAGRYRANAEATAVRLDDLEDELAAQLAPVRGRPYVVLHDAYQYLEQAFGLRAVGSITVNPERQPGARRLAALRERLRRQGAVCVFGEPQQAAGTRLVATVAEGTGAGTGELDAEGGVRIEPGPEAYFALMRHNADALADCLSRPG